MKLKAPLLAVLFLFGPLAMAQFPPIDLEWSALRPYYETPRTHISRDPVHGQYIWAVNNPDLPDDDELAYPFLPDGTDLAPFWPYRFSAGSLDRLVDTAVSDSVIHSLISHMDIGGTPQDVYWFLDNIPIHSSDPYLWDRGLDLLVTDDAVYGCGWSEIVFSPNESVGRVVKAAQGSLLWNVTWDDPDSAHTTFSSVAVLGDTVFAAAFPHLVLFNNSTGAFIDTIIPYPTNPPFADFSQLISHGSRIYWVMHDEGALEAGYYDTANGQIQLLTLAGGFTVPCMPRIAFDQYEHLWITSTAGGQGAWFRMNAEFGPIDHGTLHASIDDMTIVNGKISLTGILDPASSIVYLYTGTPQP